MDITKLSQHIITALSLETDQEEMEEVLKSFEGLKVTKGAAKTSKSTHTCEYFVNSKENPHICAKNATKSVVDGENVEKWYCGTENSGHYKSTINANAKAATKGPTTSKTATKSETPKTNGAEAAKKIVNRISKRETLKLDSVGDLWIVPGERILILRQNSGNGLAYGMLDEDNTTKLPLTEAAITFCDVHDIHIAPEDEQVKEVKQVVVAKTASKPPAKVAKTTPAKQTTPAKTTSVAKQTAPAKTTTPAKQAAKTTPPAKQTVVAKTTTVKTQPAKVTPTPSPVVKKVESTPKVVQNKVITTKLTEKVTEKPVAKTTPPAKQVAKTTTPAKPVAKTTPPAKQTVAKTTGTASAKSTKPVVKKEPEPVVEEEPSVEEQPEEVQEVNDEIAILENQDEGIIIGSDDEPNVEEEQPGDEELPDLVEEEEGTIEEDDEEEDVPEEDAD